MEKQTDSADAAAERYNRATGALLDAIHDGVQGKEMDRVRKEYFQARAEYISDNPIY